MISKINILIALSMIPIQAHAEHPYNAPPSRVNYCYAWFIGYEYSPRKERKCRDLWGQFTRKILLEESDFISKL